MGFTPCITGRHPCLDVVFADLALSQITCTHVYNPVGQFQCLQQGLSIFKDCFVPTFGLFNIVGADNDLFHLVELMDPVQTGGILAVGACFTAEAWAHRDVSPRQTALVEYLFHVIRG